MSDKSPPSLDPQILKIDDATFYKSTRSSTMYDVAAIKDEIVRNEARIAELYALLTDAAGQGVGDAATALPPLKA